MYKITVGGQLDTNAALQYSRRSPAPAAVLPVSGGLGGLLTPVTNLLNSLLGNLGGIVPGL